MPTLQFKGRNVIWNHHLSVAYHTLAEVSNLDFKLQAGHGNLVVEGDNLLALKALLPQYSGRVRCVCIDPPYNTGNDNGQGKGWVYSDTVNSPLIREWLGKEVGIDDLTRHDKWICMITPRLKLLREFLSHDGVIFVSIDDNEVYHLRGLMNEIFGDENFIALLPTIMNLKGNQDEFGFAGTHEYTLVFARDKSRCNLNEFELDEEESEEWQEDELGTYKKGATLKGSGVNAPREKRPNLFYPITITNANTVSTISKEEFVQIYDAERKTFNDDYLGKLKKKYEQKGFRFVLPQADGIYVSWRWSREKVITEPHNLIVVVSGQDVSINKKQRPSLGELPSKKPKTVFYKPEYSSGNGTNQIKKLFGSKAFNNPKPIELIMDLLRVGTTEDSLVLDSFAGSGTTGHAVMELNRLDGGTRKFILVQMTEATQSEPTKNICKDITRERLKRAIEKYGYDSGFKYLRVGIAIDAETLLSGNLPTYEQFAKYVFYLCTGENLQNEQDINEAGYFVGHHGKLSIYLIYKQDFEQLTRLALNLELAERFRNANRQKRVVVYAPACFLGEEDLQELQIDFVSIPYNLFERKG
jgi:adenine-specific DNA-methyltransferase